MQILLTPTVYSLNHLYQQCDEYCNEYDIKLNPEKSKLIAYNSNISSIYLGNNYIQCHTYEKHLGNSIGPNVGDKDIRSKITEMFVYTNHIISLFGTYKYIFFLYVYNNLTVYYNIYVVYTRKNK